MGTAIIAGLVIILTGLAFVLKHALLHAVCTMGWFLVGYTMYNLSYPGNTFIPAGVFLFSFAMILAHTVTLVTLYMGARINPPTYEEQQDRYRRRIQKITQPKSKRRQPWDI
jgi:uncharacterized membrane protein YozB (DUF420 family)